jgi:hypothetical protein
VNGRLRRWLPLFFVLALTLVPYREFFTARVPAGRDLLFYFYPAKAHLAEALRAGQVPWIDRYRWGGSPLLSNPGYAAFDPGNLLFVLLPLGAAAKVWILLRLLSGIAGFSLFARRLGLSAWMAPAAGLLYGLSGVSVSLVPFLGAATAWSLLPWLAVAVLDSRRPAGPPPVVRLALVSALLLVAGAPEFFFYAVAIALALVIGKPAEGAREPEAPLPRRLLLLAAGGLLGAALAAPAVLSGFATAAESSRAPGGGLTSEAVGAAALPAARLGELLLDGRVADWTRVAAAPSLPGYYPYLPSISPGRVGLLLALLGVVLGGRGRLVAVLLGLVGVFLALGPQTPVWSGALALVPPLGTVRYPERHLVLAGFALAWLAALGLKALSRRLPEARAALVMPLLSVAILLDREGVARRLAFTEEPGILSTPPAALAPLAGVEPSPIRLFHRDSYLPVPKFTLSSVVLGNRTAALSLTPEYPSLFGVASAFSLDYDLTLPLEAVEWTRLLRTALPRGGPIPLNFLRTAGVAAVAVSERAADGSFSPTVRPVPDPLPAFRFASRVVANPDGRALFKTFLDERCDPETAYVEGNAGAAAPSAGRVLAVRDQASGLELSVEADGPGDAFLMVFRLRQVAAEATLDGRPVPVAEAGFGFAGLRVPAGRHLVRLRPDSRWVKIGAMMSLAAAAVLGFLVWRARRPAATAS